MSPTKSQQVYDAKRYGVYAALERMESLLSDASSWVRARDIRAGRYPGLDPLTDDFGITLSSAYTRALRDYPASTCAGVSSALRSAATSTDWLRPIFRPSLPHNAWMQPFNFHVQTHHADVMRLVGRAKSAALSSRLRGG